MSTITVRPTLTHTASIEVKPGCVGIIIGRGGKNLQALVAEHRGIKVQGPRRGDIRQIFKISGPSTEVVHAAIAKIRDVASKWEKNSRRQVNRDTLHRQAVKQALAERKAKIASGQFVSVNTHRYSTNSQRVKSPGPALKSRKNRFDMLDSDDEQESPVQVMRKVTARPLQGAWGAGAPNATQTPPSSPKDDALLARKRIAQKAKKTRKGSSKLQLLVPDVPSAPPVRKSISSWADAADESDSEDDEDDIFLG